MSMGGEIIEEHYEKLIRGFLWKLEVSLKKNRSYMNDDEIGTIEDIIKQYKEHFKNNGIYGTS